MTRRQANPKQPARPAKTKTLRNPIQISEDEADYLIAKSREGEPSISLEAYLKKNDYELVSDDSKIRKQRA